MDKDELAKRVVNHMMELDLFSQWLAIEVIAIKEGYSKIKMKLRKIFILVLFTISPIISFAQKAYETVEYNGTLNGMLIKFSLADGYLPASKNTLTSKKSII